MERNPLWCPDADSVSSWQELLDSVRKSGSIETVGGLVFRLAEHVPARDEVLTHETGLEFRVLDADARHIRSLRMRVPHDWEKRPIPTLNGQDEDHGS